VLLVLTTLETVDGGVAVLTMNRPRELNALSPDLAGQLLARLEEVGHARPAALVLSGAGRSFCAGGDLATVREAFAGEPHRVLGDLADDVARLVTRLRSLPFPVIAALEGAVAGAGIGLALAADLRVCGTSTRFLPAFTAVGTVPDAGSSALLARSLGQAQALSFLVRNTPVGSSVLLDRGLVEEVVDDGAATAAAVRVARSLPIAAPLALVECRWLIDTSGGRTLTAQLEAERVALERMWSTTDCREGALAFLERRPPVFTGQ
jgi:2-(1,2-epoxy-1,2-dihydrophenyl)acetyl-CoA isomerase